MFYLCFSFETWHGKFLFLFLEESISSVPFLLHYLQMIKQKVYSRPEKMNQLSNLNLDTFNCMNNCAFEVDFNCCTMFELSSVYRATT